VVATASRGRDGRVAGHARAHVPVPEGKGPVGPGGREDGLVDRVAVDVVYGPDLLIPRPVGGVAVALECEAVSTARGS
jgi:hypothetical protein